MKFSPITCTGRLKHHETYQNVGKLCLSNHAITRNYKLSAINLSNLTNLSSVTFALILYMFRSPFLLLLAISTLSRGMNQIPLREVETKSEGDNIKRRAPRGG